MTSAAWLLSVCLPLMAPDDTPLALADLPAYRDALEAKTRDPARPLQFRDLWDHPEAFRGQYVEVEGRIVRRFHQPAKGTFPAIVEAWAVAPSGDLLCLVYPEPAVQVVPAQNQITRFRGTFLKRLRYQSADGDRLAPLIVGSAPPMAGINPPARSLELPGWSMQTDWVLGLAMGSLVALVLAFQHLRRPARRTLDIPHTDPVFEPAPETEE
jgi:hypothetical protein